MTVFTRRASDTLSYLAHKEILACTCSANSDKPQNGHSVKIMNELLCCCLIFKSGMSL